MARENRCESEQDNAAATEGTEPGKVAGSPCAMDL